MDEALQATSHSKIQTLTVETAKEAMLYENWMTLQAMERYGWENVRGEDFLVVETYLLKERLEHIYDFAENKIKYGWKNVLGGQVPKEPLFSGKLVGKIRMKSHPDSKKIIFFIVID